MTTPDLTALLDALDLIRRAATPGRWEFSTSVDGRRYSVHAGGMPICSSQPDDIRPRNNADNYRLIAALDPDTVGALTDCVRASREMRMYCLGSDASTEHMLERYDAALAALADRLGGGK